MLVNLKKATEIESSEEERINREVKSNDEENPGLNFFEHCQHGMSQISNI